MFAEIDNENYNETGDLNTTLWWLRLASQKPDNTCEIRRKIRKIKKVSVGTQCHCPKCGKRFVKSENIFSCERHEKFIREFIKNDKILQQK